MASYRALFIDVGKREHRVEEYDVSEVSGPLELGVYLHRDVFRTYNKPIYHPDNAVIIGRGLFSGTGLYGANRFTAVFRSPITRGLHAASMGGAAYQFRVNADAMVIYGRSTRPLVLKVWDSGDGEPVVEYIEVDDVDEIWRGYGGLRGIYALQQWLTEHLGEIYTEMNGRSILTGPAAKYTSIGALASITLVRGRIDWGSEEYAARGGPGSVLFRAHGVVAIGYGGKYDVRRSRPPELSDPRKINALFLELAGEPYATLVIKAGTKYRFNPKLNTGGTLGGNYPSLKIATPMFNWNMIYEPPEVRARLHDMIMKHIWEPFNKEAIFTKSWKTCGEPCPIACKKVRLGRYKSDYEPYEGFGPQIGVFDIHETQKVVELVDAYGFDAIEAGNLVAWIFDLVSHGLLHPSEVGLPDKPYFDPKDHRLEYSRHNARLALEIIENLAWGKQPLLRLIGERGIRSAAKILDIIYKERTESLGLKFEDLAVYAVFGEEGHITPNYYWTPGMVAPLPVLGRYWTLYSGGFAEPEEWAEKSYKRAVREIWSDNGGFCRFHRKWVEKYIEKLYEKFYGIANLDKRYAKLYREIAEYQEMAGVPPQPWDSEKIIDYMASAAREYGDEKWSEKFARDKKAAAMEWWERFYRKIMELHEAAGQQEKEEKQG